MISLNFENQSQTCGIHVKPIAPVGTLTAFSMPHSASVRLSICPSVITTLSNDPLHCFIPYKIGLQLLSHHSLLPLVSPLTKSVFRYFTNCNFPTSSKNGNTNILSSLFWQVISYFSTISFEIPRFTK